MRNWSKIERRPVYMNVYGGPGHNEVADAWDGNDYMFHQLLCQKGYIVVSVDPRGTQYQGAAFKKSTYLQLGKLETEDIITTAKLLPSIINQVDPARIGIMGWSYGGFMSSSAITKGADVFKMAIAVAILRQYIYGTLHAYALGECEGLRRQFADESCPKIEGEILAHPRHGR